MFDFSKLIGRIIEKYGTRAAFAAALGYSEPSLSYRLNNRIPFDIEEIYNICLPEHLDIAAQDIPVYFFTPKSSINRTVKGE